MPKLPAISGPTLIKLLQKKGFCILRQRGSHVTLVNHETGAVTVVPVHSSKELPPGTLLGILRGAGIDRNELNQLLENEL